MAVILLSDPNSSPYQCTLKQVGLLYSQQPPVYIPPYSTGRPRDNTVRCEELRNLYRQVKQFQKDAQEIADESIKEMGVPNFSALSSIGYMAEKASQYRREMISLGCPSEYYSD